MIGEGADEDEEEKMDYPDGGDHYDDDDDDGGNDDPRAGGGSRIQDKRASGGNISNITPGPNDRTDYTSRSDLLNALKYIEKYGNEGATNTSSIGNKSDMEGNLQKLITLSEQTRMGGKESRP